MKSADATDAADRVTSSPWAPRRPVSTRVRLGFLAANLVAAAMLLAVRYEFLTSEICLQLLAVCALGLAACAWRLKGLTRLDRAAMAAGAVGLALTTTSSSTAAAIGLALLITSVLGISSAKHRRAP